MSEHVLMPVLEQLRTKLAEILDAAGRWERTPDPERAKVVALGEAAIELAHRLRRRLLEQLQPPPLPGAPPEQLRARIAQLETVLNITACTMDTIEDWLGMASTRSAATDSIWRLGQALHALGIRTGPRRDSLNWRGSLVKELNDAGFFHSDEKNAFVYDPDAIKGPPYRVHGNARGPTVKEVLVALDEAVKLQGHYADLLNLHDRVERPVFKSATEWLALREGVLHGS